jgi:hypothetical protein
VFFASQASNLVPGDTNGVSDVFERAFPRRFVRLRFPHTVTLNGEKVRSTNIGVGPLELATKLISNGRGGPSDQPSANDAGTYVAYRSGANVVRTNTVKGTTDLVSRTTSGRAGNGPSSHPAIGRTGLDVLFESAASFDPNDRDCSSDIYHLDIPHNRQIFTSLDSIDRIPNYVYGSTAPCPHVIAAGVHNPAASYYLNYATWETSWPLMDAQLGRRTFGNISNDQAAAMSNSNPNLHQVYLRYLGPR